MELPIPPVVPLLELEPSLVPPCCESGDEAVVAADAGASVAGAFGKGSAGTKEKDGKLLLLLELVVVSGAAVTGSAAFGTASGTESCGSEDVVEAVVLAGTVTIGIESAVVVLLSSEVEDEELLPGEVVPLAKEMDRLMCLGK